MMLFPTRTEIVDGTQSLFTTTVGVSAPNLITSPGVGDQTGLFRRG
jgi:hypothetical protein